MTEIQIQKAIELARKARQHAFVPRTNYPIGACVMTTNEMFFEGCNIESTITGLGVCAERCAIDHAVLHGHYEFAGLVVVDKELTVSCGACLQYLELFSQIVATKEIPVIFATIAGEYEQHTLLELLPEGYDSKNNIENIIRYRSHH